jgi:para-nitrobenzyl esterase
VLQLSLPAGQIQGRLLAKDIRFFGNIPYAAAPFGARRFLAPQAPEPWSGVRDCTDFGPAAPQAPRVLDDTETLEGGEDCLTVNVWAPAGAQAKNLPVLVFIPGGGFMRGKASDPIYDPVQFVRQGVVFVSFNYRVGIDGFLHFPRDGRAAEIPDNRGLLDQLAALQWVRTHIGVFGGDADIMTLGGVSAGSGAICTLLSQPALRGMLRRVVLQSPSAACQTLDEANVAREAIAQLLGCEPSFEQLAAQPLHKVVRVVARLHADYALRTKLGMSARNFFPLRPVLDGELLRETPLEQLDLAWSQPGWPVPDLLVGANAQEMHFYLAPNNEIDRVDRARVQAFVQAIGMKEEQLAQWETQTAQHTGGQSDGELLAAMQADYYYQAPAHALAGLATRHGARAWHYRFAWKSSLLNGRLQAGHAVELPFVFNHIGSLRAQDFCGVTAPQTLADEMHSAWANFVRGEAPEVWPEFGPQASTKLFA